MGRAPFFFHLSLAALFSFSFPSARAQDSRLEPCMNALKAGNLGEALALLGKGPRPKGVQALEAARRLVELSTGGGRARGEARKGLEAAVKILQGAIPSTLKHEKAALAFKAAFELGSLILSGRPDPHSPGQVAALTALQEAHRHALALPGMEGKEALKKVDLLLLPLCRKMGHTMEVARFSRELLGLSLSARERRNTRDALGEALLALNRPKEAFTYLKDKVREHPSDPELIYPVAKGLYRSSPRTTLELLLPVLGKDPDRREEKTWRACLDLFYRTFRVLPKKKPPLYDLIRQHRILLPLPRIWGHASWRPGFRAYRKEGTHPGKVYEGKIKIQAMIPFSKGWYPTHTPPPELSRWRNAALVLRKGKKGPVIVLYWFGPDLFYWYGTTPRRSGVTGKGARGDSKGGIASLVSKLCYGPGARKRGLRFKPVTPLPYSLGIPSGVTKKAWIRGRTIFQENFFSVGQVTAEVLLRVERKDAKLLGPELRWCMKNLRMVRRR